MDKPFADDEEMLASVHLQAHRYLLVGQLEAAETLLRWLGAKRPRDEALSISLGYCLLRQRRCPEAAEVLAAVEASRAPSAHFFRGMALDAIGNKAGARYAFAQYAAARAAAGGVR